MKYLMIVLLVVIAGCDTPTRSRFPSTASSNSLGTPTAPGTFTPTPTTGTPTPAPVTSTTGFENCNLSKTQSSADLGGIGICKSSIDETQIRFVSSLSNTTSRTCIIPTYKDQYGNSTYLGDPQCTYTEAEKVYTGRLYKNRSGVSQFALNGVMIMREGLLVEYFACMDSYMKYVQYYCPANPTYPPCLQGANNYRAQICNQFKAKYPNNYIDRFL
jgi:hypothetical protein